MFLIHNLKSNTLIFVSKHKTQKENPHLFVVINGKKYILVHETNSFNRNHNISIGMIPKFFRNGVPSVMTLTNYSGDAIPCLIYFHDIPTISPQNGFLCQSFPQMTFSVCVFEKKKYMDVRFATKSDNNSPNFALGYFNVELFIQEFRDASLNEHRILVLWKMFVDALRKIGYFDIYNYNDFQTTILVLFQKIFVFVNNLHRIRELFYSFVQRILANNSWFIIIEEFIQSIRYPSRDLIELFSDRRNPPIANFIDHKLGLIGVSKYVGMNFNFIFGLVSLSTMKVNIICSINYETCYETDDNDDILSILFPSEENDDCPLLRRTPACVDTSAILQGFSSFGNNQMLIVFKFRNMISILIQRADGTFGPFNIYMFILSKIFAVGDELHQSSQQFTHFPFISTPHLVEGLLKCGFQPIFDGTATTEQILEFFFKSDFGCVLQLLRKEFEDFPNRQPCQAQLDSIRINRFIKDFKRVFEFILERLREQPDFGPEIQEIICFLRELVKFLTVPHCSE